jgi:hypothetical protein
MFEHKKYLGKWLLDKEGKPSCLSCLDVSGSYPLKKNTLWSFIWKITSLTMNLTMNFAFTVTQSGD